MSADPRKHHKKLDRDLDERRGPFGHGPGHPSRPTPSLPHLAFLDKPIEEDVNETALGHAKDLLHEHIAAKERNSGTAQRRKIAVNMPVELFTAIQALAQQHGHAMNTELVNLLTAGVEARKGGKP